MSAPRNASHDLNGMGKCGVQCARYSNFNLDYRRWPNSAQLYRRGCSTIGHPLVIVVLVNLPSR